MFDDLENNSIREVSKAETRYKVIYGKGTSSINSLFHIVQKEDGRVLIDTKHPVDPEMIKEALQRINEHRD